MLWTQVCPAHTPTMEWNPWVSISTMEANLHWNPDRHYLLLPPPPPPLPPMHTHAGDCLVCQREKKGEERDREERRRNERRGEKGREENRGQARGEGERSGDE